MLEFVFGIFFLFPYLLICAFYLSVIFFSLFIKERKIDKCSESIPFVYIVVCFFNEKEIIRKKVINLLQLNYPNLLFIFIDDFSTDGSVELVSSFNDKRIILLKNKNKGKTQGQNFALDIIPPNSIVIFNDCNVLLSKNSVWEIVKCFSPDVGGVVANVKIFEQKNNRGIEGLHWELEKKIKLVQGYFGAVIGFDGGFYALRSELYTPLPEDALSDFEEAIDILAKGYKIIFCQAASAVEFERRQVRDQFASRRRVTVRTLWALKRSLKKLKKLSLLVGFFLLLNKYLRYYCYILSPVFFMGILLYFSRYNFEMAIITFALVCFISFASLLTSTGRKLMATLLGIFAGFLDFLRGKRIISWEKQRL